MLHCIFLCMMMCFAYICVSGCAWHNQISLAELVESSVLKKGDVTSAQVPPREFVRLSKSIELMKRSYPHFPSLSLPIPYL